MILKWNQILNDSFELTTIYINTINDDDGNDHETATIFKRYKFPSMNNVYNFFQISFSMLSPNYSAIPKSITNSFSALFFQ